MQDYKEQARKEIEEIMNEGTVNNVKDMNFLKEKINNIDSSITNIQNNVSNLSNQLESKDSLYGEKISTINNELDQKKIKLKKRGNKLNIYRILSSILLITVILLLLKIFKVF